LGQQRWEAVVLSAPGGGRRRDPFHQLHHVCVVLPQRPVQDGFVVGDAIAKLPDPYQRRRNLLASEASLARVRRNPVQCLLP
jgi:hypothetical protein